MKPWINIVNTQQVFLSHMFKVNGNLLRLSIYFSPKVDGGSEFNDIKSQVL